MSSEMMENGLQMSEHCEQVANDKKKPVKLPLTKVKTIMKMSNEVQNISQHGLHLVARATEMFIHYLSKESQSENGRKLDYNDLANVVDTNVSMDFLRPYLPKKITYKQFKEKMASKENKEEIPSEDSDLQMLNNCVFDYSTQSSSEED